VDAGIVRDVESALEKNELVVVYQPILELASGAPCSAEALIRRALPDGGLVPPAEFVPHVERTPLVRELTFLVVADALDTAQQWSKAGHELGVSINIPYRLLDDSQFADGLADMLRTVDPTSPQITLEVVPSGPGAGSGLDVKQIERLRRDGVRLSLDDLGRASSIAAIRTLPLDQAKIDAMFLHSVGRDERSQAIVRSLVGLAHTLGLEVVAEGVETRLAWDMAARLGCDRGQGFFLGHPLPPSALVEWLERQWPVVTSVV
jgi:EAL domain-containing protein (putative c-di-GMP-specific phosphodiesterase class I)